MPLAHSLIRRSFCHSAHPPIVSGISFSLVLMSLALSLTSTIRRIDCAFISFVFPPANNNNKMPYCILHMVRYASSFTHSHTKTDGTRWKLFGTNWRQTRARRRRRTFFVVVFVSHHCTLHTNIGHIPYGFVVVRLYFWIVWLWLGRQEVLRATLFIAYTCIAHDNSIAGRT